ncbi:MAG TPA: DUF4956 domain-containing protein [Patescibacteria group bacterium]|nr:DUF4956 domain-containing protein [Patescibacteria group bacterium]
MENLFSLSQDPSALTLITVIINILLAFALSLSVALAYRYTHRGLSYSQSFNFTLVLIGMMIAVIMMIIGNSLAIAFGAFGAFSLIRFRSAIKDTKDIAFILMVVAIGLAVGTSNQAIAVVATIMSIIVILTLTKINFGSVRKYDYLLSFSARSREFSNDDLRSIFNEFLRFDNLLNVTSRESGQILDYNFNIKFIKQSDMKSFIDRLNQVSGVNDVDVVSAKNDIEY